MVIYIYMLAYVENTMAMFIYRNTCTCTVAIQTYHAHISLTSNGGELWVLMGSGGAGGGMGLNT